MICLDTNAVIFAINGRVPAVQQRLRASLIAGTPIVLPTTVLYEMWYGIRKSARPEANAAALRAFLTLTITSLPFDAEDAEEAGDIRAALERAGTPIGPYDLLIAAQARRRGAVLVTANVAEFTRVPGLTVEDWSNPAG